MPPNRVPLLTLAKPSYLHINGLIHRDVKAANLLIDDDGTVLLGDLGVAAFLWDSESSNAGQPSKPRALNFDSSQRHNHQRNSAPAPLQRPTILGKRKSFVGTPCWMAPEVINGKQYDASADIWSFGITAIELAQGRAPRSRLDPHKVLVMTVTDEPPKLERNAGPYRYSSAFAEIVAMCLTKDASKRPSAAELLQTSFFRNARKPSYLCSTILRGLPPLTQRQERRKQPSIYTHATMDSWDFSPSLPASPTTSVLGHVRRPRSLLPPESVFEMEDGQDNGEGPSQQPADASRPDGGGGGENGDDEGDHAAIDGHSSAEAYVVRIRERHRNHHGRFQMHSRSSSYHSHHSHHSHSHHHHSRHYSHEEPRATVHSIQEVIVQEMQNDESSDTDRDEGVEPEAQGIPVAVSPTKTELTTLPVPSGNPGLAPSTSPCPSSHSSTSVTSSTSSPSAPATPPPASFMSTGKSQRGSLWRRLAGKADTDTEKEKEPAQPPPNSPRKRSFGAVLGRTAHMSADLVRTASRTMSCECSPSSCCACARIGTCTDPVRADSKQTR